MILYGASVSPYVRKVLAYAAEKGLTLEHQPISPFGSPPAEFLAASPFRKIPAFTDGDFMISDSTAIIAYLEAKFPEPVMIPADPAARARVIWYEEFGDTLLTGCVGKMFFNRIVAPRFLRQPGDQTAADTAEREEMPKMFDYLESVIPASGYLVGDRLTLADIAVATAFANLRHVGVAVDTARWPKTAAWAETMLARPSFAPWCEAEAKMLAA